MALESFEIAGSFDNQRINPINAERTINLFEYTDPNAKKPKMLIPTSGLRLATGNYSAASGGARVSYQFQNAGYLVFGETVFQVTGPANNLVASVLGTIGTTTGYVGIHANNTQVIFVDGQAGYIFDTTTSEFSQITDEGFPANPKDVTYLDGFFTVIQGGSNVFGVSAFQNGWMWSGSSDTFTADAATDRLTIAANGNNYHTGTTVTVENSGGALPGGLSADTIYYVTLITAPATNPAIIQLSSTPGGAPIDITSAGTGTQTIILNNELRRGEVTSHPGTLMGCATLHRLIYFFSENFTEVWQNAGLGSDLPFRRVNSMLLEVGTPATASIVTGFDRLFFLSQDRDGLGSVMEVVGGQAVPVSNRALDYQIAQYAEKGKVSDARGILIKENGLIFYRLNFTLADHTYVFGVSNSSAQDLKWHEEEMIDHSRHVAQTHMYYQGVNFYGDYKAPKLYIVDDTYSKNVNDPIRRVRITRNIAPPDDRRLRIDRFQLDLLQGKVDQPTLINDQPKVFLQVSKDGGQTYGNYISSTMGKIGQRTYRTVWRKLGTIPRGQGFLIQIQFFNETPFYVLGASWAFEVMPE